MGEETVKPLIAERLDFEEKGYFGLIAKIFELSPEAGYVANKLKKLENEHMEKIDDLDRKIARLNEDREKLISAIEILRGNDIAIPEECALKQSSMMNEENQLKAEVDKEKVFLDYLQSRILTLIK